MSDTITVNGKTRVWRDETMRDLVVALGLVPEKGGIAIAVNAAVVPRAEWPTRRVAPDDRVEIVQIVRGG
ncbi:MAG: sulfur carrier protein ThiS [Alphaproteobacteria bacterium]|nr:sulfur carrier protein ThiS [Alphaproteobacteria bacterium]